MSRPSPLADFDIHPKAGAVDLHAVSYYTNEPNEVKIGLLKRPSDTQLFGESPQILVDALLQRHAVPLLIL